MTEYAYQTTESWNTSLQLASTVGRLRIASNLKAVTQAQEAAFEAAGRACASLAEASAREMGGQAAAYRDARGYLAQVSAWLHVIAELTNEPNSVFAVELDLADQASKQVAASLRAMDMRRDDRGGPPRGGPGGPGGPRQGGYDRPRGGPGGPPRGPGGPGRGDDRRGGFGGGGYGPGGPGGRQ